MKAPLLARLLLTLSARREERDALIGDLEEVHRDRLAHQAPWVASLFSTLEALGIALGEIRHRTAYVVSGRWVTGSEVRLALRLLVRTPVMTITSVFALAVGVAIATIGYTAIHAILHPSLPFEGGDRWVTVQLLDEQTRQARTLDPELYRSWEQDGHRLDHLGVVRESRANLALGEDRVSVVSTAFVTPATLSRLPFRPVLGRSLTPRDGEAGAPPVALLTEGAWDTYFGSDPSVIGRAVRLGEARYTVVGILPDAAIYPTLAEVWIAWSDSDVTTWLTRALPDVSAFGYLAAGADAGLAEAQFTTIAREWSAGRDDVASTTTLVRRVGEVRSGGMAAALLIALLIGALGIIAGNVGNLVVARTAARAGELSVRRALGASRARLVGQLALEVLVMTVLATGIGFAFTRYLFSYLTDRRTRDLPITMDFGISPRVLLFVFAATLFVVFLAGLGPALRSTRDHAGAQLKSAARGHSASLLGWFGQTMIVVQIALSIGVLGTAVMIHRGWMRAYVEQGLDVPADQLLMAGLSTPRSLSPSEGAALQQALLDRLQTLSGVRSAALSTHVPGTDADAAPFELEERRAEAAQRIPAAYVGLEYFGTVGHQVVSGRGFSATDFDPDAPRVALVNAEYADQVLGGRNPVGTRLREPPSEDGDETRWIEIVGVVGGPALSAADPERTGGLFLPLGDAPDTHLLVRAGSQPVALAPRVRAAAFATHPDLLVSGDAVLSTRLEGVRRIYLVMGSILTGLGALVLALSLVAVYALLSFEVTRRTREIGVRVAMGATRTDVVRPIVRRVGGYALLGGVVGTVFGLALLWVTRETLVLRFPTTGAGTFLGLSGLTLASALLAAWVPTVRALSVQPVESLRAE